MTERFAAVKRIARSKLTDAKLRRRVEAEVDDMMDNGVHFAVKCTRLAKLTKDLDESGFDWSPIEGTPAIAMTIAALGVAASWKEGMGHTIAHDGFDSGDNDERSLIA